MADIEAMYLEFFTGIAELEVLAHQQSMITQDGGANSEIEAL
jgi:hypothetical protein